MTSRQLVDIFDPCLADRIDPTTQYIVVRRDLPVGHMVAQVAHAAGIEEHPPQTNVVVLAARDEAQLRSIADGLALHAVPHVPITESEGAYAGQLMALACRLLTDRSTVRKVVSSLPLVK